MTIEEIRLQVWNEIVGEYADEGIDLEDRDRLEIEQTLFFQARVASYALEEFADAVRQELAVATFRTATNVLVWTVGIGFGLLAIFHAIRWAVS